VTGSICAHCARFNRDVKDRDVCEAFPEGIPREILFGGDHDSPVPGDNGLFFVPLHPEQEQRS
jgi:hypothetical protein